ncbi:pathogenesis-related transcriptional factor and ERF protein [Aporhodopirellula aestuarii]|uniref:Pathogenesis-related transcriptional factor and ERF protein n=1 Tax=Aporhodopirellula aestuarii TaxID=2950107 RepID=A0ABT0UA12_9BACT|nr:pathogenesis-related transcriptional factor and ERF protein [Aporhodopirellula aestuarii]MCM2373524.1 pathogenesis-related transcriptional factor and ERF protein [Aporhodopirellula aestuarii]
MSTTTVAKGITRFEMENRSGYMVRISRGGTRVNKYFSDSKNGGKRKAFAAAKKAYDDLLAEMGPPENSTRNRLTSRNTTGVVGVHVAYSQDNRYPGCAYSAYCASWVTEDGRREKASFAWNKYGEDRAFELAVLARERQITDRDQVVAIYERSAAGKKAKRKVSKKAAKPVTKRASKKASAKKSVKKSVKKSARKVAKKSVKKSARKTAKKSVKKAASKKTAKKAAKKVSKKRTTKRR